MKTKLFVPGWSHSIKMLWLIEQKCFIWIMLMSSCICSPPRGSPTGTVMQMLPNSMISHGLPGLAVMLCIFPYGQVIARLMVNIPQRISPCCKAGLNTTNKVQCPYSFPLEMEELLFIKHFNLTQYTEMKYLMVNCNALEFRGNSHSGGRVQQQVWHQDCRVELPSQHECPVITGSGELAPQGTFVQKRGDWFSRAHYDFKSKQWQIYDEGQSYMYV